MTEAAMYAALGFLVAMLLALSLLPAVNRRSERLAKRRLEALFPLSIDELNAQKDHLRAQFAVDQRRLERKLDKAGEQRTLDLAELGRKEIVIATLEETVARYLAIIAERDKQLIDLQTRLDAESTVLKSTSAALAASRAELALVSKDLAERSEELAEARHLLDAQRADISALDVRVASADVRIADLTELVSLREAALAQSREEAASLAERLDTEQLHGSALEDRIASLSALHAEQARRISELNAEAKDASQRLTELSAQASRREAVVAQRDAELASLRTKADRLAKQLAAIDDAKGAEARDMATKLTDLSTDNLALRAALEQARTDRAALKREINKLAQSAKSGSQDLDGQALDGQALELRRTIDRVADEVVRAVAGPAALVPPHEIEAPRRAASRA